MNYIDIEPGGSNMDLNKRFFNFIQDMILSIESFGEILGKTNTPIILSGVIASGISPERNYSSGYVYWNGGNGGKGEVLYYPGGLEGDKLIIGETGTEYVSDDVEVQELYRTRRLTLVLTAEEFISPENLMRVNNLLDLGPIVGEIKAWAPIQGGSIQSLSQLKGSLPEGWKVADGNNNTVNLKGRFLVGYDGDNLSDHNIGSTGGSDKVLLSVSNLPPHSHGGSLTTTNTDFGSHEHSLDRISYENSDKIIGLLPNDPEPDPEDPNPPEPTPTYEIPSNQDPIFEQYIPSDNTAKLKTLDQGEILGGPIVTDTNNTLEHSHTITLETVPNGGTEGHENRPEYFSLVYLQFVGLN